LKEIRERKFGFAYTYPYKISDRLQPAKSVLHAQIRMGYAKYLKKE
jgi:hypothetical protein